MYVNVIRRSVVKAIGFGTFDIIIIIIMVVIVVVVVAPFYVATDWSLQSTTAGNLCCMQIIL